MYANRYGGAMGYGSMGMGMGRGYGMNYNMGSGVMDPTNSLSSTGALDANGMPIPNPTADGTVAVAGGQQTKPLSSQQIEAQRVALLEEQKKQRKMFLMEATLQVVSGTMQLLMQLIMGMRDVAGIVMGVYYSYYTLRSFRQSISGNPAHAGWEMQANGYGAPNSLVPASNSGSGSFMRALKIILGAAAIYSVAQTAMSAYQVARGNQLEKQRLARQRMLAIEERKERHRAARRRRNAENADVDDTDSDASTDSDLSSCASSMGSHEDEIRSDLASEPRGRIRHHRHTTLPTERKIYVAEFDHEATMCNGDVVSFRKGDRFEVDVYDGGAWCNAVRLSEDGSRNVVLVPGNYLKPLQMQQKI